MHLLAMASKFMTGNWCLVTAAGQKGFFLNGELVVKLFWITDAIY